MKRTLRFSSTLATCMMAATTVLADGGLQQPYLVTPDDSGAAPWGATFAKDQTTETLPSAPAQAYERCSEAGPFGALGFGNSRSTRA